VTFPALFSPGMSESPLICSGVWDSSLSSGVYFGNELSVIPALRCEAGDSFFAAWSRTVNNCHTPGPGPRLGTLLTFTLTKVAEQTLRRAIFTNDRMTGRRDTSLRRVLSP